MRRRLFPFVLAPLLALAVAPVLFGGFGNRAQADHIPGHPTIVPLARSHFVDEISAQFKLRLAGPKPQNVIQVPNASEVVVLRITFRPGDSIPWHTHPGPAIVAVTEGELTITNAGDCVLRPYAAGEGFLDPGAPNAHRADNFGDTDAVVYVTFLGIPPGLAPTNTNVQPASC